VADARAVPRRPQAPRRPGAQSATRDRSVWLLWDNWKLAAGAAVDTLPFRVIPVLVVGLVVLGALGALYLRYRDRPRYELLGRIALDDTVQRD
jgi:hypothetical protein